MSFIDLAIHLKLLIEPTGGELNLPVNFCVGVRVCVCTSISRLHIDPLYLRGATLKMRRSTSGARGNVLNG